MISSDVQLDWPTTNHSIAQGFGQNATVLYDTEGLKGHPGLDIGAQWGDPIFDSTQGKGQIYKVFHNNDSNLMNYRAVCQLLVLDDCVLEITYGHINDVLFTSGYPTIGQQLATVGNTGDVFSGSHEVTEAEKVAGSHAGAHLHFQVRYCLKSPTCNTQQYHYLADERGTPYFDGSYYLIPHYEEGFNGCIDPLPFLQQHTSPDLTPQQAENLQQQVTLIQRIVKALSEWWKARG